MYETYVDTVTRIGAQNTRSKVQNMRVQIRNRHLQIRAAQLNMITAAFLLLHYALSTISTPAAMTHGCDWPSQSESVAVE